MFPTWLIVIVAVYFIVRGAVNDLNRAAEERETQRRQEEWFAKPLAERMRLQGCSEAEIEAAMDDSIDGLTWAAMTKEPKR